MSALLNQAIACAAQPQQVLMRRREAAVVAYAPSEWGPCGTGGELAVRGARVAGWAAGTPS